MQESVTSACGDIGTALAASSPTWSANDCETLQADFAKSAAKAAEVLTKLDELARGDGFDSSQAGTMNRVLQNQGTACDVRTYKASTTPPSPPPPSLPNPVLSRDTNLICACCFHRLPLLRWRKPARPRRTTS